jgi:hypothetical protein
MRRWLTLLVVLTAFPAAALAQTAPPPPTGQNVPITPQDMLGKAPGDTILQKRANDFAHPMLPWDYYARPQPSDFPPRWQRWQGAGGQILRYIEVPAQQVIIPVPRAVSEQLPLEWHQELVTVPGYYIAETTTGYYYFERWTLEQANYGVYQWRLLPAQFVRK